MTTKDEIDDVLILTDKDLCFYNPKVCKGTTLKGKPCRNKTHKEFDYCKLHREKFRLEKPDECPICMENLNDVNVPLSCSHWVHRKCILNWGKNSCPICRENIKMTSDERRKIQKKNRNDDDFNYSDYDSDDNDIILPPQLIEFFNSLIRSYPESMRDGFVLNVDINDTGLILINGE